MDDILEDSIDKVNEAIPRIRAYQKKDEETLLTLFNTIKFFSDLRQIYNQGLNQLARQAKAQGIALPAEEVVGIELGGMAFRLVQQSPLEKALQDNPLFVNVSLSGEETHLKMRIPAPELISGAGLMDFFLLGPDGRGYAVKCEDLKFRGFMDYFDCCRFSEAVYKKSKELPNTRPVIAKDNHPLNVKVALPYGIEEYDIVWMPVERPWGSRMKQILQSGWGSVRAALSKSYQSP